MLSNVMSEHVNVRPLLYVHENSTTRPNASCSMPVQLTELVAQSSSTRALALPLSGNPDPVPPTPHDENSQTSSAPQASAKRATQAHHPTNQPPRDTVTPPTLRCS